MLKRTVRGSEMDSSVSYYVQCWFVVEHYFEPWVPKTLEHSLASWTTISFRRSTGLHWII